MKLTRCTPANYVSSELSDFSPWLRTPFAGFPAFGSLFDLGLSGSAPARLATDVYEDADNYYARFEVPGVKKDAVKIELHDRQLTVSIDKTDKSAESEQTYSLTRAITVPDSVASEHIAAKLEEGLLTVTLPKQEQRKPRMIQVA